MEKLGKKGLRILKILHIMFAIMWIGGVMALVSLQLGVHPDGIEAMRNAAVSHLAIDEYFLIPGGIGIVVTAITYGIFTRWGFFQHRWLTVKWILTILLVIIGVGYMGVTIKENMVVAQQLLDGLGAGKTYWHNVYGVAVSGIIQIIGFIYIVSISVIKPWKK